MSDIDKIRDSVIRLRNEIAGLKVPGFLKGLKDKLMKEAEKVDISAFISIESLKTNWRVRVGKAIREWWATDCPWWLRWLRPIVMPPIMRTIRGLMKRI